MNDVVAAGLAPRTIWVSHLSAAELAALRAAYADFTFRPRSAPRCGSATAARSGHRDRARRAPGRARRHLRLPRPHRPQGRHLLVVSGGTAHGIGLEAPSGDPRLKARAATLARGGLDAAGFVRSPYSIDGKQRLFAEPPHMQASMLFLPQGARVPEVGDELEVRVRYTATAFDKVIVYLSSLAASVTGSATAARCRGPRPRPGRSRRRSARRSRTSRPASRRRRARGAGEVPPHAAK